MSSSHAEPGPFCLVALHPQNMIFISCFKIAASIPAIRPAFQSVKKRKGEVESILLQSTHTFSVFIWITITPKQKRFALLPPAANPYLSYFPFRTKTKPWELKCHYGLRNLETLESLSDFYRLHYSFKKSFQRNAVRTVHKEILGWKMLPKLALVNHNSTLYIGRGLDL